MTLRGVQEVQGNSLVREVRKSVQGGGNSENKSEAARKVVVKVNCKHMVLAKVLDMILERWVGTVYC